MFSAVRFGPGLFRVFLCIRLSRVPICGCLADANKTAILDAGAISPLTALLGSELSDAAAMAAELLTTMSVNGGFA